MNAHRLLTATGAGALYCTQDKSQSSSDGQAIRLDEYLHVFGRLLSKSVSLARSSNLFIMGGAWSYLRSLALHVYTRKVQSTVLDLALRVVRAHTGDLHSDRQFAGLEKTDGLDVAIELEEARRGTTTKCAITEASIANAVTILHRLRQITPAQLKSQPRVQELTLDLLRKLSNLLSNPINISIEMATAPLAAAAVRVALDLEIFSLLAKHEGAISTRELSCTTQADELLTKRILRAISGIGFIDQVDCDLWQANPTTQAMALEPIAAGYRYRWDVTMVSAVHMPQYLRKTGHKSPSLPDDGAFQFAHRTNDTVFEYLRNEEPDRLHDFNLFMGHTMGTRATWLEWYPIEKQLLDGAHAHLPLLVDIGGGKGHDVQALRTRFPYARGRVILQDLSQAFDSIGQGDLHPDIELQVHDFFMPNPVAGARIYLLHHILHDWSDDYCLQILSHIHAVMTTGYSTLLINELIVPEENVTTHQAIFDLQMMVFNSGIERTQQQWASLLSRAGFKIQGIWHGEEGDNADGVIEAVMNTDGPCL